MIMAGVLAIMAVVFHFLAKIQEQQYRNSWYYSESIILTAFVLVALLLLIIAGYALIHSKTHAEIRFKDAFRKAFHSYWVYFLLFVLLMTVITRIWGDLCIARFGDSVSFKSGRWDDIKGSVFRAPVVEEAKYRVLPFLIAVIPLANLMSKRWKIVLGCFFALMFIGVQLQFGYSHISPLSALLGDTVEPHIYNQGVCGILFAVTFGVVLYVAYKEMMLKQQTPNKFKAILLSLPLAYLASCMVHGASNLYWILSRTF